jgi:ferrous iron transport protein B
MRRSSQDAGQENGRALLLVGNLKVGKTALFTRFAGARVHPVTVEGTTVPMDAGRTGSRRFPRILDAPGFQSLYDASEDAQLVRQLVSSHKVGGLLLVLDAKNLRRGVALALELAAHRLPAVIALNLVDEARQRGISVDAGKLEQLLGVPVVPTDASEGTGLPSLRRRLEDARPLALRDGALAACAAGDPVERTEACFAESERIVNQVMRQAPHVPVSWSGRLSAWTRRPFPGIPIALLVLALAYAIIGVLGAGVLTDLLEARLFNGVLLPRITGWVARIPWSPVRDLLVGPFGLLTAGLVLSAGIVLPVLATFFFVFALLEDSGYLPRLSLLADRFMRLLGLDGKGLLPLIMGFSCVTMALLTARMLNSRRQRLLVSLLLVACFPCAPLLSVMLVVLRSVSPWAGVVLFGVLVGQFLLVGVVAQFLVPGRRPDFVMELPSLRWPRPGNILLKTGHRLLWFLREGIPYFFLGCLLLFSLQQVGLLNGLRDLQRPVLVHFLGLPRESADALLMSMIRREAGAALLVSQMQGGLYTGNQVVVSLVVLTVMVPCVNSMLVLFKEQGLKRAAALLLFVVPYALLLGGLLSGALRLFGARL